MAEVSITGSTAAASETSGAVTVSLPSGFSGLANTITRAFAGFASDNSYTIRFDNDPRATPSSGWWLKLSIEFDNSFQKETGIKKFRVYGSIRVTIRDDIKKGYYQLYEIADKITDKFSGRTLAENVILRTPQLQRAGLESDKVPLNVAIPYQYDF